mgnify:CR=1 FL=1
MAVEDVDLQTALPPDVEMEIFELGEIALYNEDLARLDQMVEQLKERGFTKANRSALIRLALEQVDLSKAKKGL